MMNRIQRGQEIFQLVNCYALDTTIRDFITMSD